MATTLGFVTSNNSVTETNEKVLPHNNTQAEAVVEGKTDGEVFVKNFYMYLVTVV